MIPGLARNAVVAASAGTGKTELLTSIYLGHCLGLAGDGTLVSPTQIVATTFSRAAAREIRERLEKRFAGVATADDAEFRKRLGPGLFALATERGLSRGELARRATRALDELPDASIDTLHNLCARVLREHGLELGITPSFTILEEQRALEDAELTIDEVLSEALAEPGLLQLGAQHLLDAAGGLERLRGWMLALLSRLDDEGLDATELLRGDEGAAARRSATVLYEVCRELSSDPSSARAPLARAVLDALATRRADGSGLYGDRLSRAFAALAAEKKGRNTPGAEALKALLEQSRGSNNSQRARAIVRLIVEGPTLDDRLRGCAEVIAEIQQRLRQRHVAQQSLGFGDLLRLTRDGLRDHPEVARVAGARIELLLVDEFQDTSRVQCDLLLLLRERRERSRERAPGTLPCASDVLPRGLVVVGDRKQSIYGFRGADVSVFAELSTALAGAEAARLLDLPATLGFDPSAPAVADVATLVDSYRSDAAIVEAVNIVAERDFAPRLDRSFEIRYAPAEALRVPESRLDGERGRFTLLRDDNLTPDAEPLVQRASGAMRTALTIAGFCARAVQEGQPLSSLAVLARRRATLPVLGFALDHFGVPYVVAGRDLYGTTEVRDVFAALRLSQAPRDRHALAVVARSPLGGLSDQALLELSDPKRGLRPHDEWSVERLSLESDRELAALLQGRLTRYLELAPRLSPRDAIFDVVERFELTTVLSLLPRGGVRLANIGRLQEIAATHGGNLAAFTRFVTRQIALEMDETEAAVFSADDDAVRLLTIHGSKGLAFPTVILGDPEAVERPQTAPVGILRRSQGAPLLVVRHTGEDGPVITDTQLELSEDTSARAHAERQRLSYVALTRAQHELVIALPVQARSGSLAKTLQDLHTEGALQDIEGYRELAASDLLGAPKLRGARQEASSEPPALPREPRGSAVVLGVTALSDFQICPRRFSLVQLQGLTEPRRGSGAAPLDVDPRLAGIAAHHVLEVWPLERWGEPADLQALASALQQGGLDPRSPTGEMTLAGLARFLGGSYAARVKRDSTRVLREVELMVTLEGRTAAPPADRRRPKHHPGQLELFGPAPQQHTPPPRGPAQSTDAALVVKATLDLLVELRDGSLHVIDYKRTSGGGGDLLRYGSQLSLYRSVVERKLGKTPKVGLLHLLGDADEPDWVEPEKAEPAAIARAFLAARARDEWALAPERTCLAVRCGFVTSCYATHEV